MQGTYSLDGMTATPETRTVERVLLGALLLLTLLLRLSLSGAGTLPGDMEYWVRWSQTLTSGGLRTFYAQSHADYLPIYPYILWVLGKAYTPLQHLASNGGWNFSRDTLYKLPAIFADVATVQLIYHAARRWSHPVVAGVVATVYAANPAIIANSARWGQVDSIPAYLMLLALVLLIEEHLALCGVVLALSVLTKPTALVLVPLIVVMLLRDRKVAGLALLAGTFFLTSLAVIWPFVPTGIDVPQFVAQRLGVTTGTWSYATMKAFNFWAFHQRNVLMIPDAQRWLGLSMHTWGWVLLAALALPICALVALHRPEIEQERAQIVFPAAALLCFGFFMLLTRIHERHLLPTLPLLALTCALWPRFWPFYIWLSAAYLLNLHFVARALFNLQEPVFGQVEVSLISGLNLLALLALLVVTVRLLTHSVPLERSGGDVWA